MSTLHLDSNDIVLSADQKYPYKIKFDLHHRIFLTVVIACYYIAVAVWNCPDGLLKSSLMAMLRIPVDIFAVEQTWNMFGPNLRSWNGHSVAVITFTDGSSKIYEFPRMEMLTIFEKYKREKMRKLFIDNMNDQNFEAYLPSIAQAIADANYQKGNEPRLVTITLKYADIPAPNQKTLSSRHALPQRANSKTLIVYKVQDQHVDAP